MSNIMSQISQSVPQTASQTSTSTTYEYDGLIKIEKTVPIKDTLKKMFDVVIDQVESNPDIALSTLDSMSRVISRNRRDVNV